MENLNIASLPETPKYVQLAFLIGVFIFLAIRQAKGKPYYQNTFVKDDENKHLSNTPTTKQSKKKQLKKV